MANPVGFCPTGNSCATIGYAGNNGVSHYAIYRGFISNMWNLTHECGYGCSDHASWYRRGFPTVFPTEAKFDSMFRYLHTEKDIISPVMSFEHSLVFSKIALAMALDLGNSTQKAP